MAHPFQRAGAETAPLLALFGPLAREVGALVRAEPPLAARLVQAPPRAVHAIAIHLHLAGSAEGKGGASAALSGTHPRDLLRAVLPDRDPRLYKLLDRAALPAWRLSDYLALHEVLGSEVADVLPPTGAIGQSTVREALAVLRSPPVLRRARRAAGGRYEREHLEAVVAVLDAMGLTRDLAALPDGAGARAVARRVAADLGRAEAPPTRFPVPAGWTRINGVGELFAHGERMRLCIRPGHYGSGEFVVSLLLNRSVFLHHAEAGVLAQFRALPADRWALGQCVTAGNGPAPDGLVDALRAHVRAAGVVLLPSAFGEALDGVLRPLRDKDHRRRGQPNGGADDFLDLDGGDDLAA